ncbi:MAG: glycosyltransferase family 4 protein, partial [Candidatus Aenigmarchaeota archaeon]|nr:glycosyltransferase family 4 protein [Candidatus Aenigmarchaeota archaeon]
KESYRIKLIIVGKDKTYEKYLEYLIDKYKVRKKVELLGKIPFFKLPEFYSAADLFVLPSLSEGLPKVVLEALACGTPIVATAVSGIPEIIEHEKTGLLVPPTDYLALVNAIKYAIENENGMKKMAKRGRKFIIKNFSWKKAAHTSIEIYKSVTG